MAIIESMKQHQQDKMNEINYELYMQQQIIDHDLKKQTSHRTGNRHLVVDMTKKGSSKLNPALSNGKKLLHNYNLLMD